MCFIEQRQLIFKNVKLSIFSKDLNNDFVKTKRVGELQLFSYHNFFSLIMINSKGEQQQYENYYLQPLSRKKEKQSSRLSNQHLQNYIFDKVCNLKNEYGMKGQIKNQQICVRQVRKNTKVDHFYNCSQMRSKSQQIDDTTPYLTRKRKNEEIGQRKAIFVKNKSRLSNQLEQSKDNWLTVKQKKLQNDSRVKVLRNQKILQKIHGTFSSETKINELVQNNHINSLFKKEIINKKQPIFSQYKYKKVNKQIQRARMATNIQTLSKESFDLKINSMKNTTYLERQSQKKQKSYFLSLKIPQYKGKSLKTKTQPMTKDIPLNNSPSQFSNIYVTQVKQLESFLNTFKIKISQKHRTRPLTAYAPKSNISLSKSRVAQTPQRPRSITGWEDGNDLERQIDF